MPNGDLLSKEVVNWTRSDRQRRYEHRCRMRPGFRAGTCDEPAGRGGREVQEIMKTPPPRVVFKGFGETSLNFTLLAWVATVDLG